MNIFMQIFFNSLEIGGVYALAALGVILIFSTNHAFNYAQGVISMFCAFMGAHFMRAAGANVWLSTLVAVLFAVAVGVVIDRLVISRTLKVNIVAKQIITLGLVMVFLGLAPMFFGTDPLIYQRFAQGSTTILNANITHGAIINIAIGVIAMASLFLFIRRTRWGLAVRATASNDIVARMMGIPTPIVTMGAWAVAAALGTLAALMIAPTTTVTFTMMDSIQITALLACVLGGLGTFHGPVIAAYIIAFTRNLAAFYISSVWAESIVYLLILIVLMLNPNGLFGKKTVKKV